MEIIIYRGTHQIGGCITEIRNKNAQGQETRILIDIGSNLPGYRKARNVDVNSIAEGCDTIGTTKRCDAIFVTHYHGDHIGEYVSVPDGIDIYIGEKSLKMFKHLMKTLAAAQIDEKQKEPNEAKELKLPKDKVIDVEKITKQFKAFPDIPDDKGGVRVIPIHADHSAFDSYMFLVEAEDDKGKLRRVLHTGDFRLHGLTGTKTLADLKAVVGEGVDVLISEGTMLSRENANTLTEAELKRIATKCFEMKEGENVFVLCSSTNIDSIKSFYDAAVDTNKLFIVDEKYQYEMLKIASENDDRYSFDWSNIYACPKFDADEICNRVNANKKDGFCMLVRPSGAKEGKNKFVNVMNEKVFADSLFIYSLWDGYIKDGTQDFDVCAFIKKVKKNKKLYENGIIKFESLSVSDEVGIEKAVKRATTGEIACISLHTSGHATEEAIKAVEAIAKPKKIIPIHSENPYRYETLFGNDRVRIMYDGQKYDIGDNGKELVTELVTISDIKNRCNIAEKAKGIWKDKNLGQKASRYFHLRPSSKGVQIICTLPEQEYAMTGIKCTFVGNVKLLDVLKEISSIPEPFGKDEIISFLQDMHSRYPKEYKYRSLSDGKEYREAVLQANFINMLVNNAPEKEAFERNELKCGSLTFVASEFVIHKGSFGKKDVMDVLAICGNTLYIFELKFGELDKPYNGIIELYKQMRGYKAKFSINGTRIDEMKEMLKVYPNNQISEIDDVKFFAVSSTDMNDMSKLKAKEY